MKIYKLILNFAALTSVAFTTTLQAQSSAFTYQGELTDNGSPANGIFDIFTELWDAPSGGAPVATAITNTAVAVSNGLFTVSLDFGSGVFDAKTAGWRLAGDQWRRSIQRLDPASAHQELALRESGGQCRQRLICQRGQHHVHD